MEAENKKKLSDWEMLKMETFQTLKQIEELRKVIIDRDLKSYQIQSENLKLKLELLTHHSSSKKSARDVVNSKSEEISKESRKFNIKIAHKYDLEEGWGYNPDTGEIIETDE